MFGRLCSRGDLPILRRSHDGHFWQEGSDRSRDRARGAAAFHEPFALGVARNVRPPWHGLACEINSLHGDRAIADLVIA
jgi:hypothetical protein